MIAASKLNRRIGCSVTSAAYSGVKQQIEKAAGLGAQLAIFRQIAAGLPHHPDRRHLRLPAARQYIDQRLNGGVLGHSESSCLTAAADLRAASGYTPAPPWPRRDKPSRRNRRRSGTLCSHMEAPNGRGEIHPAACMTSTLRILVAARADREIHEKSNPLVGSSASDPVSAAQPAPSKPDSDRETRRFGTRCAQFS